jgi:glycosyltransferase involved in cell wall biosynthesis
MAKKRIMLFADWFEPGYRAGGPIRSCVNFVQHMKPHYEIYVFTSDRDLGSTAAYENVPADQWHEQTGGVKIYYCSPAQLGWKNIRQQLHSLKPDFIYLNSMFSKFFSIYPLLISSRKKSPVKIILSPRGMLKESAIQFKPLKKKIFLSLFRSLGFQHRLYFQAADETEKKDIQYFFGPATRIALIPNFSGSLADYPAGIEKPPGYLSMVFVGRIHPIKNLHYLLAILNQLKDQVRLAIVGSLEDPAFWNNCQELIHRLPANVAVDYLGEIPNHQLPDIIRQYHIFVLPTKGENFGHAIFEALSQGKPALISDQTPWRNLAEKKAGWDLPLNQPALFRQAIEQAAAFNQQEYDDWSYNAWKYVRDYTEKSNLKEAYLNLFN